MSAPLNPTFRKNESFERWLQRVLVPAKTQEHKLITERKRRHRPDEYNPIIPCACGCGKLFPFYDDEGRPRRYRAGHNPIPSMSQDQLLALIASAGIIRLSELIKASGRSRASVTSTIQHMRRKGLVERAARYGHWQLVCPEDVKQHEAVTAEAPAPEKEVMGWAIRWACDEILSTKRRLDELSRRESMTGRSLTDFVRAFRSLASQLSELFARIDQLLRSPESLDERTVEHLTRWRIDLEKP